MPLDGMTARDLSEHAGGDEDPNRPGEPESKLTRQLNSELQATVEAYGHVLSPAGTAVRRQGVFDFASEAVEAPAIRLASGAVQRRRSATPVGRSQTAGPMLFDLLADEFGTRTPSAAADEGNRTSSPAVDPIQASTTLTSLDVSSLPNRGEGERAKARDILGAIKLLKEIGQQQRPASPEEKQRLARFPGFGAVALSIFPDPLTGTYKNPAWQTIGESLQALLTPEEYASAKRSTFNAFYTSPTLIAAIHEAVARLGLPAHATVLEPGCGPGRFLSLAPQGLRFIGVELDQISGRIAQALYPDQDIRIENFRDTRLPEGSVDCVLGNVPFANLKLEYGGQKMSLHDFFIAKSVDTLKPGGILALITSRFTLDKQNASAREYLASKADFLGAIRLPSNAFQREGTAVVSDILFLRKRAPGTAAQHVDAAWLGVEPLAIEGVEVSVNGYFLRRAEMVLGAWSRKNMLYDEGFGVEGTGDIAEHLRAAIARLPTSPAVGRSAERHATPIPALASQRLVAEGSFFKDEEGGICRWVCGQAVPVEFGGRLQHAGGTPGGRRIAALIRLRDLARRVLQSQNEEWSVSERDRARWELNWSYDYFVAKHGPINKTTFSRTAKGKLIRRMPNMVTFRDDPDAMLVMSLENYDEQAGKATKAAIMKQDVVGKHPPVTSVQSAEEGLLVSLDQTGEVDLPLIATLCSKTHEQVVAELGDLVFQDPESRSWQTADAYLSGNVRAKLAAVLQTGAGYARNAEALQAVQPADVLPGDIDAHLGAPWIPTLDIKAFAADLFRVALEEIDVGHLPQDAVWSIVTGHSANQSVAATSEYGTARARGASLLEHALNMKSPVIYDTIISGDHEERIVNQEETLAAREKQRLIKERFRGWIFSDPERTERLVRLYNDTYNNLRPRLFDGSHLQFPGMNRMFELFAHQRAAVWRCMTAGNTLLAQAVGAGKTFILGAAGMKMKQAGLIQKPMYVVPNHLLEQFAREFMQLYPNARLLVAGKEDLTRERRKHLTAKVASGQWDGVLVTHSSFERIGMSRRYQEQFLREQIEEYERLLCDAASADESRAQRNLIKTIEKNKAAREERLTQLLAEEKKDDGLVFDELGVDHVFVDEAQYYKNLETPTKMQRVAGIQTGGSQRAFDLFLKARYLHARHPGHGVTFATGTPISNTMVEMYTMQRYLDPEGLRQRGLEHFDAWAATFGEVIDAMEITPDGASMRSRSRFARFTNLPELQQMFRSFADVQTADMLDLPRPRLEGDKAQVIACPMSAEQRQLQEHPVERYERIRHDRIDPRVDNALAITTDGRKLAIDARMLAADAPDFPESKINALAENVAGIWQCTNSTRGTQLVFCDLGINPTPWGYSVYQELIAKLVARGIPLEQIAAMGEADSDAKKQALFERVRSGRVRILLGSTQKMGTGTNVQRRLVALHHLDAPWKPAEVEQREGRILRQGNENEQVSIYRYVTEGSFDAYMWQALESKARFIAQIMTGESAVRTAQDIGGQELSYAEVKAIASGNPAVLTLAEAEAELQRLAVLKKNHADEQYLARLSLRRLPQAIADLSARLSQLHADRETIAKHAQSPIQIGERDCLRDEAIEVLKQHLERVPDRVAERCRVPLGSFHGLSFGIRLYPHFAPEVYLEGATTCSHMLSREHHGARAVLNALDRLAGDYDTECARVARDLAIAQTQLRDYQARLGIEFVHETYLSQLSSLRDQLKAVLSGTKPDAACETPLSTSEVVEQMKVLRATHTIEAATRRKEPHSHAAEEPVTARIRRRLAEVVSQKT